LMTLKGWSRSPAIVTSPRMILMPTSKLCNPAQLQSL
jgi:hypothetical protein